MYIYIDRDTKEDEVISELIKWAKSQRPHIRKIINSLQEKPTEFRIISLPDRIKAVNREIQRMQAFLWGAVVPYYYRQKHDVYDRDFKIPSDELQKTMDELKEAVGFYRFNSKGEIMGLNSLKTLGETKEFANFINDIRREVFGIEPEQEDDQGHYLFPNSEKYKENYKKGGKTYADAIALDELIKFTKRI